MAVFKDGRHLISKIDTTVLSNGAWRPSKSKDSEIVLMNIQGQPSLKMVAPQYLRWL